MASQGPQPSLSSFPTKAHRAHSLSPPSPHTFQSPVTFHDPATRSCCRLFQDAMFSLASGLCCASTWLILYLTTLHVRFHFLTITSPGKCEVHPKVPQCLTLPCCTRTTPGLACSGLFPPDCGAHGASLCLSQHLAQCLAPRRRLR